MKLGLGLGLALLNVSLIGVAIPTVLATPVSAQAQDSSVALARGYRTGYSDGYMAGYRDIIDSNAKNYARHSEYGKADRAYSKEYGLLDDYRDAYQQGFETGYETGYERRSFDSVLPGDLKKRGSIKTSIQTEAQTASAASTPVEYSDSSSSQTQPANDQSAGTSSITQNATVIIPRDTEIIVELQDELSTEKSREGDKFTSKVVSPSELNGSIIEGRVTKSQKPGRIKRQSQLSLSFDRIVLPDGRWSNLSASMVEVMALKGDNIAKVDSEGTAIGKSSLKTDAIKVGGATGAGLITGAIIGGPLGAGVGAGIGAAFGVGAVVIDRGNHVRMSRDQQVRIKTAYETQIR